MPDLEAEWSPDSLFPAESDASEVLAGLVRSKTWVRLWPDIPDVDNVPPVWVTLGQGADRRFICTGLIVGALAPGDSLSDIEISSRVLRQIRVPELIEGVLKVTRWDAPAQNVLEEIPHAPPRVRKREYDDDHFRDVAAAYRDALQRFPRAPIKNLSLEWHQTEPTLRRWIQTARHKGFLGPSTPGRAGESATTHPPKEGTQ